MTTLVIIACNQLTFPSSKKIEKLVYSLQNNRKKEKKCF